jgi:hypothetical protein
MYWQFVIEYSASKFAALPLWSVVPIVGLLIAAYFLHRWGTWERLIGRVGGDARAFVGSPKRLLALGSIPIAFIATGGIGYAIQEGYLFPATVVGRISTEGCRDVSNVWVAAFLEDSKQSVEAVPVDRDGFFRFEGLRNRPYSFVAYEIQEDRLYMSRFSIDPTRTSEGDLAHAFPREVFRISHCSPIYYDSAQQDPDERAKLGIETCRQSLPGDPQIVMWLGHADEKGSDGANRELGADRAFEAARAARGLGFASDANQLILSFGENRPAELGRHAAALAANRRVEIVALYRERMASAPGDSPSSAFARKR